MSVRAEKANAPAMPMMEFQDASMASGEALGEGNSFAVAAPENPLKRTVVVSIKASLNDLCLQKARGTWAPSQEALRSICKPHHSNHLGTVGLRPTVGDADRTLSFSQSSRRSSRRSMYAAAHPPNVPFAAWTHDQVYCRLFWQGTSEAMGGESCPASHPPPPVAARPRPPSPASALPALPALPA